VRANVCVTSPPYATQREYDSASGFKPIPPDQYADWFGTWRRNVAAILADDGSYFLNIKEHADNGERDLYVKDLVIAHRRQWGCGSWTNSAGGRRQWRAWRLGEPV